PRGHPPDELPYRPGEPPRFTDGEGGPRPTGLRAEQKEERICPDAGGCLEGFKGGEGSGATWLLLWFTTCRWREHSMMRGRPATLSADEQYCQELTRREAANFYWGFVALPRPQRMAIYALYSFARQVDDDVDLGG